jgi:Domain of unknown function DUF11/Divergent InlB B-repeat domain
MNAQRIVFCLVLLLTLATINVKAQTALITVKIVINGTGTGSVTSLSPTVNCSSSCSVQVPAASNLTLHATAASGSSFLMWTGACSDKQDCNLSALSADKTVTATFIPATAQLKLAILGGGAGSITISPPIDPKFACTRGSSNCVQTLPKGTLVHLKAVADGDSVFGAWSGTGTNPCAAAALDCEFTLNDSVELTAGFGWAVPHTLLQVTTGGTTGGVGGRIFSTTPEGAIDCGLTCQAFFSKDQTVKLLAVPDASSSFAGWSDENGQFISQFCSTDVTCDLPAGENGARATFKANPLGPVPKALFVSVSPPDAGYFEINPKPNCTNIGCSNYTSPAPISIQAFNKPGFEFKNWSSKTGFPCKQTGSYLDSNCGFYLNGTYDVIANYVTIASISADLQTSLQAPSSVAALEEFQVTATLFNAGPIEASNVALSFSLPSGVNLVSVNSSAGVCQGGSSISCNFTGLPSGSSISLQLTLRAPSVSGKLDWRASGGSPTPSTITDNNTATASTQVTGGTTLSLNAIKPANSPADGTALKGANEVPMLAFKLTPSGTESFSLNSILLKTSGTGRGFLDYLEVHLYQDTNQNAQVDAGEALLASTNFEAENPTGFFLMYLNPAKAIASAGSSYLVTVNFNSTLAAQHFSSLGLGLAGLAFLGLLRRKWRGLALGLLLSSALVSCPDPPAIQDLRTYQISLSETRVTAASQAIIATGLPLTGATISVAK